MENVQIKTGWDFSPLTSGKSFEEKRADWQAATSEFVAKWKLRKDYLESPEVLKEALDEYEAWMRNYGAEADELVYYWLKTQLDENDPELKAKFSKAEELGKKAENDVSFFELSLAKIPKEKQKGFLDFESLRNYKHFLERLFESSKYLLSESEEKIMNMKSTSSYSSWVKMLSGFLSREEALVLDENEKEAKKSFEELFTLVRNKNSEIRDRAAEAINSILEKHSDVAEAELNAVLQDKKVNDELRGYERPDKARHVADDIDSEIVDSLVEAVSDKLEVSKRFYELKAKILGLKKLKYHERNLTYGSLNKEYSYEDSIELVYKVLSNLDNQFAEIFKRLLENGQADAFPRTGKRGGAFCSYVLKSQPTYVMLNHANNIRDVTTIAHEFGHAINDELMRKQNALNFGTPLSTAEVASTFMEDFILQELTKNADDEMKLALMIEKLDNDVASIIRQISCYKFEQELHKTFREKGYLSKEEIGKLFQKHMSSYMGDFVEQSPGSENWWIYWSHIRTFFYNYSYASGLIISKALQALVKEDKKNIEKVKQFLSAGLSKSPKDIFADCGIDITKKEFWVSGLNEVENLLDETEALAKSLGKI